VAQKERADKAETLIKPPSVRSPHSAKKHSARQKPSPGVRTELKTTAEERDALKVRNEELQKAVTAAETATKQAREELEALKKTVAENKQASGNQSC
jgi:regulator of replication initiation timing